MSGEDRATPKLAESVRNAIDARIAELHTCLPAAVISYDPSTERASVRPLLKRAIRRRDGERLEFDLPVIEGAPVAWPRFGGWVIRGELAPDDIVTIHVAERSLERWLAAQDTARAVAPGDSRKHDLSDAIVVPGLVPSSAAGVADLVIGRADGSSEIRMRANGEILLSAGGEADEPLVRGSTLERWLTTELSVATGLGPSGPAIRGFSPGVLSALAKVR